MIALVPVSMSEVAYCLGWTLVHSLWQFGLMAALSAIALRGLTGASARLRYRVACATMAGMVLASATTFAVVFVGLSRAEPTIGAPGIAKGQSNVHASLPPALAESVPTDSSTGRNELSDEAVLPQAGIPFDTSAGDTYSPGDRPRPFVAGAVTMISRLSDAITENAATLSFLWLAGFGVALTWRAGGWLAVARMKHLAAAPSDGHLLDRLMRLAASSKMATCARLLESNVAGGPAVIGWLRPVIIVPTGMSHRMGSAELDAILAHELAHIRRRDYAANLIQTAIETVFFHHPAVWWVSSHIRTEREHCCDDEALAVTGNRQGYAHALRHWPTGAGRVQNGWWPPVAECC